MKNLGYGSLFEGWEVAIAKHLVNEFKKLWRCLDNDDFEDLLQECLIHFFSYCCRINTPERFDNTIPASPLDICFLVTI